MTVRQIVITGLLIAVEIVLTRFFSIQSLTMRISFGFIAVFITAYLYGPIYGGTMAAISDILGMMIFPKEVYFPGFTATAFITGYLFGIFFYNKTKINIMKLILSIMIINTFNLLANTFCLTFLIGRGYIFILTPRIVQTILLIIIQYVTINYILNHKIFLNRFKKLPS